MVASNSRVNMHKSPLIVIIGETASGKSALAIELAGRFNGEIICADSRTVYKGMDIGTAKPSSAEQGRVPHHLLDVVEPNQAYSVVDFQKQAEAAIEVIYKRGKLPIIVGGTGLYVDSLLFNFSFRDKADPELRAELEALPTEDLQKWIEEQGIEMPLNHLNRRHLVRAIETAGQPPKRQKLRANTLVLGLQLPKEDLEARIKKRVSKMVIAGLEAEVKALMEVYGWESEAMKAISYREWQSYFQGQNSLEETIQEIIIDTKRYAKRQRTWFRRHPFIQWLSTPDDAVKITEQFLANQH